ncbi:hypothetical protein LTR56_023516 [Elasticomyces elasticus]|nr:hypothetical protein LTR56_023516 [Elasticomyces elasticus]KAK4923763.1 hypothetical protein LTR49_009120 [Elasticomyces elasticus]KAK5757568.1 hypothetical protein LTS12_012387 [Elasticomyces elasticus]
MTDAFKRHWDLPESFTSKGCYSQGEYSDGPVIAAAGLADLSCLQYVLDLGMQLPEEAGSERHYDVVHHELIDERWSTPLLRAIERQRPENIRLLVQRGALADGIQKRDLIDHALRFRRFCDGNRSRLSHLLVPVDPATVGPLSSQTSPDSLTVTEIEERRSTISRFWAEPSSKDIDYSSDGALMHSVLMATTSTPEILDIVLGSGADVIAWKDPASTTSLPDNETDLALSQLCTSTPLHAAIAMRNTTMLRALLERGFDPNARALITGSQALTPAQYAVVSNDVEALSALKAEPATDLSLVTPVFHVHANHFAVAQLNLELLLATDISPFSTPPTSLGHSLLHIACLPMGDDSLQLAPHKIRQSVHDIRYLHTKLRDRSTTDVWDDSGDWQDSSACSAAPALTYSCPVKTTQTQLSLCKYLVEKDPNWELISWIRQQEGGEEVWVKVRNFWGHSAVELSEDGEAARSARAPRAATGRGRGARVRVSWGRGG